jgi:modification methylase
LNRILVGDALSVLKSLPDGFVDAGVTSPPYNKRENKKGWLVKNVVYSGASDNLPEAEYQTGQIEVLNELYRVTRDGGSFFYNHKLRWENGNLLHPLQWVSRTPWIIRQEIIWDRMIAANIRGWRFWQVEERIYWLYKPLGGRLIGRELKPEHARMTSIWRFPPENENPHPAPFPLALPLRAIHSVLDNQKGVVIDPYCGSGTTLAAAVILGHDYLGVDISREYVRFAQERLRRWRLEVPKAQKELSKHKVETTFAERKRRGAFVGRYRPGERTRHPTIMLPLRERRSRYSASGSDTANRKRGSRNRRP